MNKCQQSCFHKLPMHIPGAGLSSEAGSSAEPSFFSSSKVFGSGSDPGGIPKGFVGGTSTGGVGGVNVGTTE